MNSNTFYHNNSELSLQVEEDEFGEGSTTLQRLIAQQSSEIEQYKQEIHQLQLKLGASNTVQNELQEMIETHEETIKKLEALTNQKVQEAEEKNAEKITILSGRINELEITLLEKVQHNTELQQKLNEVNEKLLSVTIPAEVTFKDDLSVLEDKIQELMGELCEVQNVREQLEDQLKEVCKESAELREIYEATKERLVERDQALEVTRDELTECRIELENLKISPADQKSRGNSLFAEVEDRRQKALNTVTTLKQGYNDIKRSLQVKDNEIKVLKAEKAALLTTLQNDQEATIQQYANLNEKYKDKISELTFKLEDLQKKYHFLETRKQPINDEYEYFQTMLETKTREIEDLNSKIENASIQALLEQEMKCKTDEQHRFWRQKAMAKEAQFKAIESRLEMGSTLTNQELLQIIHESKIRNTTSKKTLEASSSSTEICYKNTVDDVISEDKKDFKLPTINLPTIKFETEIDVINELSIPQNKDLIDLNSPNRNKENNQLNSTNIANENAIIASYEVPKLQKKGILKSTDQRYNATLQSFKTTAYPFAKTQEDEKKSLRFSDDTIDPKSTIKKIPKQATPKYKVIYVSSKEAPNDEINDKAN